LTEPNALNVDLSAVQGVITQLGELSTSLGGLIGAMQDGSNLKWTGADKDGRALNEQLAPAEQGGIQAVQATQGAVDGLMDGLVTTGGLWGKTEGGNVELNQ
jgi:hypothetical protein